MAIPGEKNSQQVLATLGNTAQLFFRPALCYADPLSLTKGQKASTGPVPPTCGSTSPAERRPTSGFVPTPAHVAGYDSNTAPPDPQFTTYPSTSPFNDNKNATVILPSLPGPNLRATVIAACSVPPQLTGTRRQVGERPVHQRPVGGRPEPDGHGRRTNGTHFAQQQFHQIIAMDLDGQVISAPITLPTQGTFTPFNGKVQISGSFTETQAKTPGHRAQLRSPAGQARPAQRPDRLAHAWARPRSRPDWPRASPGSCS